MLDEPRILSRLRSSHAAKTRKTTGRPKLLPSLSQTVHDKSIYSSDETMKARITNIQCSSKQLSQMFSDFEIAREHDSPISVSRNILIEILIRVCEFDVRGLQTVLEMLPAIDPSLKTYLPRAMSKLGRYYCVACDLIDAARSSKYTLFRRVSVRALEKPLLNMAFIADHSAGFDQALQRVSATSHQHPPNVYDPQHVSAARTKFQSRMSNCTIPWKVHAEIQLLLFYEQQPHKIRPRIISSSKSACYLCNLFIHLHGEFHISRTHGRLYDRWILPERPINEVAANRPLLSVINRLNEALEVKIIHTLSRKPLPFPHPDESVLLLREPWSSNSTLSRIRKQDSIKESADCARNTSSRVQLVPLCNTSPCSLPSQVMSTEQDRLGAQPCVDMQPDVHLIRPIEVFRCLSQGDSTCCKLTSPRGILIVQAGPARLHASWDSIVVDTTYDSLASGRACWVHVQWPAGDDQTAQDDTSFELVDVGALARDRDTVVEGGAALSSKQLALQVKGQTLRVKYTFEEPADTRGERAIAERSASGSSRILLTK